jgi:hypothetical protein
MPRRRSNSIDLGQLNRGYLTWVERIGREFSIVNPTFLNNDLHNCTTCAQITANALVNGTAPFLAGGASAVVGGTNLGFFNEDDENGVWALLRDHTVPGGVYLVEDEEDHVFNFVRDYEGYLFLVDSNTHTFRPVTRLDDTVVREGAKTFRFINPGEEGMTVYYRGQLHANWT